MTCMVKNKILTYQKYITKLHLYGCKTNESVTLKYISVFLLECDSQSILSGNMVEKREN